MARPKKEGMDYFPHDTDAVNDEKLEALRYLYGNDGYAFYFILLERIYRTNDFELDVSDAETIQILAKKVGVTEELFNQMLQTALKRGCFDKTIYEDRRALTSNGIKNRASVVVEKRVKMREKYQKDKDIISDAETPQETGVETPQSKGKKRRVINSPKSQKQVYDESSVYFQLANYLYKKILTLNPDHKQPNLQKWSDSFRLMMERDNRTEEQIKYVIDWVNQDSFWGANILSPDKLRKQFDSIVIKIKSEKKNNVVPMKIEKPSIQGVDEITSLLAQYEKEARG